MKKKHTIYVGFDGAYVMSRLPIVKKRSDAGPYLAHEGRKKYQTVDLADSARVLFGHLKLRMFEVVKMEMTVSSRKVQP